MYKIRIINIAFFLLCLGTIYAQDIEVKKFEPLEKDQTAVTSPRKDINGTACGLVKVALKEPGAEFEGNVMGDVQFTGKEYLVYLTNGTKRLGIKHPDYLPTTIVFADYGTKRVASSTTYELIVKTNKKKAKVDNSKKGMAVFNIKPSNAMLLIDGQIADGLGGTYTLSLPYGTHYYTVKLKDFSIKSQMVKINKNTKSFDVDLTDFFAKVCVDCQDKDAEIIINDESVGMGQWNGLIAPGTCVVEVVKSGYHAQSKTIDLMENDSVVFDFPALRIMSGFLKVNYRPNGCEVYVDGNKVGVSPLQKELPVGEYKVVVKKDGYLTYTNEIKITDGKEMSANGELEPTQFRKLLMDAEGGNIGAQACLADFYFYGSDSLLNHEYYWDYSGYQIDIQKAKKEQFHIRKDILKEIEWRTKEYKTCCSFNKESDQFVCYRLMTIYLVGEGIKQDYNQSFYWANRLLDMDWKPYWLAWHYFYGRGVNRDVNKALYYLKQSWNCTTINKQILNSIGREVVMIKEILDIIGYN